jgi:hypothetical protein
MHDLGSAQVGAAPGGRPLPTARLPAVTQASTCALNLNHQRRTSRNSYALHPCRPSPRPSRHPDRSGGISRWPKPGNITGLRTPDSGPVPIPQSSPPSPSSPSPWIALPRRILKSRGHAILSGGPANAGSLSGRRQDLVRRAGIERGCRSGLKLIGVGDPTIEGGPRGSFTSRYAR